ncbi:hypothetical protein BD408DRAFT_335284, partial [Parasitella parasitica]
LRNISSLHWKVFWSLSLTKVQRNVIYRLIAGSIPNRSFLHSIMPAVFDSPRCPICLTVNDSTQHLFFHCPTNEKVWQGVIFEFLCPTTTISDIKEALLSLDFTDIWYCQLTGIKPYKILLISLSQLWLAHMRFIFNQTPMVPTTILASIRSSVHQAIGEDQCHTIL